MPLLSLCDQRSQPDDCNAGRTDGMFFVDDQPQQNEPQAAFICKHATLLSDELIRNARYFCVLLVGYRPWRNVLLTA